MSYLGTWVAMQQSTLKILRFETFVLYTFDTISLHGIVTVLTRALYYKR